MSAAGQSKADLIAALKKALSRADLLHQNSVGCAIQHHGLDCKIHGLPGWLAEAQKRIAEGNAALTALASEPEPQPVAGWQWREWHDSEDAWGPWQYGQAPAWLREEGERFEQRALFAASPHLAEEKKP